MTTWISIGIIALTAGGLVHLAARHRSDHLRRRYISVVRAVRWWMLPAALLNLVVLVALLTAFLQIPALRWGWWSLLGGSGNASLGQTSNPGLGWRLIALALPLALLVALPALALVEEYLFREGSEDESWPKRVLRQTLFGFVHCLLAGLPLAAGFALTAAGLYFTLVYLHALRTAGHTSGDGPPLPRPLPPLRDSDGVPLPAAEAQKASEQVRAEFLALADYDDRIDTARERACTVSAAAHLVNNTIVICIACVMAFSALAS